MAITIETDFEDYNPVYNDVEVAVSSTNSGNSGFKFVFEVTVEGETMKTFKVTPEPSQSFGVKDFHSFLETFVVPEFGDHTSTSGFEYSTDTIRKFDILYKEEWLVAGVPTIGEDTLQGGDKYIWEGSLRRHDWVDEKIDANPFNTYLCNVTNGTSAEFLTKQKTRRVRTTDLGWVWFMTDTPNDTKRLEIKTYDGADGTGSVLGTWRINNLLSTSGTLPRLQRVAAAPQSLNNVDAGEFDTGTPPVIDSNVVSYTIQLVNSSNVAASEILTFNMETDCRYEVIRVHYENELGGYDSFNFKFRNQRSEPLTKETYMSDPYRVTASGLDIKHEHEQSITHYIKTAPEILVRSPYLSDQENEDMRVFFKSTSTYIEFIDSQGNNNFKPVKEIKGTWREKVTSIDKLHNQEATLVLSWNDYSQRK